MHVISTRTFAATAVLSLFLLGGCPPDDPAPDGGAADAGSVDAGGAGDASLDAGSDAGDAGTTVLDAGHDAGPQDAGHDAGPQDAGDASMGDAGVGECATAPDGRRCRQGCAAGAVCVCIDAACVASTCGDGVVAVDEDCDDGNTNDTDECTSTCDDATCGDHHVRAHVEQCDDGNTNDADGCSNVCRSLPAQNSCPDGTVGTGETCDDGNLTSDDVCRNDCTPGACGDGILRTGGADPESCDDGNTVSGDGCSATCAFETCDACQQDACLHFAPYADRPNLYGNCHLQVGNATAGPRAGTSRAELCTAFVACAQASGCAWNASPSDCFCGAGVDTAACEVPQGACIAEARAAAESNDVTTVVERFLDPGFALGDASLLLVCSNYVCADRCAPSP